MTGPRLAGQAGQAGFGSPRVVVTVGTDHHPFDRLIEWVNGWLASQPDRAQAFFVQSGMARVRPACPGSPFLEVGDLDPLLDTAELMICHGGPGCISSAWARGHIPIVAPRLRRRGEHVDDHQVDFCRKFAELGRVRLAETQQQFGALLDEAMTDLSGFRSDQIVFNDVAGTVARFAALVDGLVGQPQRRHGPGLRRSRRAHDAGIEGTVVAGQMPPGPPQAVQVNWQPGSAPAYVSLAGQVNEEQE